MKRLDSYAPVRTIGLSRRSLSGRVSRIDGGSTMFESSLERDWLLSLDFDPAVCRVVEQPFTIEHYVQGQRRRYTPDILVEYERPNVVEVIVYEVKPRDELIADWALYKPRFKAAVHYCKQRGWRFKILTEKEIRTPVLNNAKFLRRYRHLKTDPTICHQLLYTLKALGETTPQGLLAAAYWPAQDRALALPMLWKLIAERTIITPLHEPITMSSCIWLPE